MENINLIERGSILVLIKKQISEEIITTFLECCEEKDIDDDDTVHLFQCREDCTDENYRPPELSLVQISKLRLYPIVFERNGYFYTFSADISDMYGKGLTQETSFQNLLYLITDNIRCCNGGIYPLISSDQFRQSFCETLFNNFIDNNDHDNHSNKMIIQTGKYIEITIKDKSIRSFIKLIKKLIANNQKSCTVASYNEWIMNGYPVINGSGELFYIEFYDGKICWDKTTLTDEGIRIVYFHTSKQNLAGMIERNI